MNKSAQRPKPLGRGLSALFGDQDQAYRAPSTAVATPPQAEIVGTGKDKSGVTQMAIEWIQPGAFQPRRHFDDAALQDLAASIKERGILQPLLVRPLAGEEKSFEIIAGERRWRAAQRAGLHDVPVIVREMTDDEAMEIGLIENVQREGLSPLEEAEGYQRLLGEFAYTQDRLASVVGKSRSHITNLLRLLTLPPRVRAWIEDGSLSTGAARAVISAKDPEAMATLAVKRGLNVRQIEDFVRREHEGKTAKKGAGAKEPADANILAIEKELTRLTGLKTNLKTKGVAGVLSFEYKNLDQLDALISLIQAEK